MSAEQSLSPQQLEDAFAAFNEVSGQLAQAYAELEGQVERLSEELAAARSERLEELAEKERLADRLSRLLEALPGGVVVLDGERLVREHNPAALALLGEPLLNEPWDRVCERAFRQADAAGTEVVLEHGQQVSISAQTLATEPGEILLLQDVTETRELQEQVNRQHRLSAMGEMAARLAHQIRTPLASALLTASQLEDGRADPAKRQHSAQRLQSRLRHLERMVNDMLVFARGGGAEAGERVDIDGLVEECASAVRSQANALDACLTVTPCGARPQVSGNGTALHGAVTNLLTNALEAGGAGTTLELWVDIAAGGNVRIVLCDDGPGIPAEVRERIFEPFFTTRSSGTGLGLAVVRAVIAAHQGHVYVESSPGRGTRFTLELPSLERGRALASGATSPTETADFDTSSCEGSNANA